MRALRRAIGLLALAACAAAEPVAESVVAQPAVGAPVPPAAVAVALRAQIEELAPLAGSPGELARTLDARLASPTATPVQALACRYLASSLRSEQALPLVRGFVLRSRAPEAARINAELSSLAAPYQSDPALREAFAAASKLGSLDDAQLKGSLDRLFEKSSGEADARPAVLGGPAKTPAPAPEDIPRLGPSIADLRVGAFHENDPVKIVVMHEPGAELMLGNQHPEASLFTGPVDWKKASAEHARYRAALEAEGAQVYLVRDVLLAGTVDAHGEPVEGQELDALRRLAGEFLEYDTKTLVSDFEKLEDYARGLPEGAYREEVWRRIEELRPRMTPEGQERYKAEVLKRFTPEALVNTILTHPTVRLFLQIKRGSDAFYAGIKQEVSAKPLMNLYFARDQQITTHKGVVINQMAPHQRRSEARIMKFVFQKLGVPIVVQIRDGAMDGGDYIPAGDLVFQGVGLRTTQSAVNQLLREDAYGADEVAVVRDDHDQSMDRMHLDTVFNVLGDDKVIALEDVFKDPKKKRVVDLYRKTKVKGAYGFYARVEHGKDFQTFLEERGFHIATVSHADQLRYALNFLNVGNGRVLTPYGDKDYLEKLKSLGVDAEYVPMKCLTDGYGAAHCMTQVIRREPRL